MKRAMLLLMLAASAAQAGPIYPDVFCPTSGYCSGDGESENHCEFQGRTVYFWTITTPPVKGNWGMGTYKFTDVVARPNQVFCSYEVETPGHTMPSKVVLGLIDPGRKVLPDRTGRPGDVWSSGRCYQKNANDCRMYYDEPYDTAK